MSINVINITKEYGNQKALDNVSFNIAKGEIIGFLGPNGAGKSTMMKILTTFINATEGEALVNGYSVSSEALKVQKLQGTTRKLVAFKLNERGIPRKGYDIVDDHGHIIGHVTSGTMSPSLSIGIGMGYVKSSLCNVGQEIHIQIRKKLVHAVIVKLPFYKS